MKKTLAIICVLLTSLLLVGGSALAANGAPATAIVPVSASAPAAPASVAPIMPAAALPQSALTTLRKPAAVAQAELANLYGFTGTVEVETGGETIPAYEGMRLYGGDVLRTSADSTASLDLDQGRLLLLDANGELQLQETSDGGLEVYLKKGAILNDVAKGQAEPYTVRAANVTMGVLGTVFRVSIDDATGVAVTDLYEGKLLITFTTSDGQEHSYVLEAPRRFTADTETLGGSGQQGGLITEEIYLDDLSPALLSMLEEALRKREDAPGVTELLEQIEALRCDCGCTVCSQWLPAPAGAAAPQRCSGCHCGCAFCSAAPAASASDSNDAADVPAPNDPASNNPPPPAPEAPEVTAFRLVFEEMEDGCVILSDYPSILSHAYRIEAKIAENDGEISDYTVAEYYGTEYQIDYTEITDDDGNPTGLFYYNADGYPYGNIDGFTPGERPTVYLVANGTLNGETVTIMQMMETELGGLEYDNAYYHFYYDDREQIIDQGNPDGDIVILGSFVASDEIDPPATLSGEIDIRYFVGYDDSEDDPYANYASDIAISNEPPDTLPRKPTEQPNYYDPEYGGLRYDANDDTTLGEGYQAAVETESTWNPVSVALTYELTSAYKVTELNEDYFDPDSEESGIISEGDWQTVSETVTETITPPPPIT